LRLALQLQTQFGKESDSGWKVIDNYADVVHSEKRDHSAPTLGAALQRFNPWVASFLPAKNRGLRKAGVGK
jgi:hypothetical protein